ncbi:MAG: hypothetical protein RLZZ390_1346 [Bacteroidota bacterium]
MISIGNFFFKYRNQLFIFLYALLLVPSPELITEKVFGPGYWQIALWVGLFITTLGVVIRGITIGLTFIERGGNKELRIHAEALITKGLFTHCRNPLYVGNNFYLPVYYLCRGGFPDQEIWTTLFGLLCKCQPLVAKSERHWKDFRKHEV